MRRGLLPLIGIGAVAAASTVALGDGQLFGRRPQGEAAQTDASHDNAAYAGPREGRGLAGYLSELAARLRRQPAAERPLGREEGQQAGARHAPPLPSSRPILLPPRWQADAARIRSLAEAAAGGAGLPPRFDDAELLRYAGHHGYFAARTPAQREAAVRGGAAAAAATAAWLRRHAFAGDAEVGAYRHLIAWEEAPPPLEDAGDGEAVGEEGAGRARAAGAAAGDRQEEGVGEAAAGRPPRRLPPTLRVCIGLAMTECRGPEAAAFGNAVITQMERAVSGGRLQNTAPRPAAAALSSGSGGSGSGAEGASGGSGAAAAAAGDEGAACAGGGVWDAAQGQVVVVLDMGGGTLVSGTRTARLITDVASTLNTHYPGRLYELHLLNLPVVLGWLVAAVKTVMHPGTRGKLRVVRTPRAGAGPRKGEGRRA